MKSTYVRLSLLAAALAGAAAIPATAAAEVSASATVSNIYLWRGLNLGGGTPQIAGTLEYTTEVGAYAGLWASSAGPGQEVDTYVGFRGKAGELGYNIAAYKYNYPTAGVIAGGTRIADFKELYLNVNMSGAFLDAYMGLGETGAEVDNKSNYLDVGYTYDKFTAKYGMYDIDTTNCFFAGNTATECGYSHVDVSYAYNANLAFTLSTIVNSDTNPELDNDTLMSVSYTLPLDLKK